jgi:hypothetical protein
MGNGLGLVGAYGAQGGRDALEELIAQRMKETLLKQQEVDRAHGRQMSEGHLNVSQRNTALGERNFDYGVGRDTKADEAAAAAAAKRAGVIEGLPEWAQGSAQAQDVGLKFSPEDLLEAPETREGADRRKVKLTKIEDDIRTDNEIRQARSMPRSQGSSRLVQVMGPDGTAVWMPESAAAGMRATQAPRAVTGAERKELGFFQRMLNAERNARAVEGDVSSWDVGASEWAPGFLENWIKTPAGKKYAQAQRMFTEGRLRADSGAAVPQNEYEADATTNFRRGGDDDAVITQKRNSRLTTLRGQANRAGRALQEYYGDGVNIDELLKEFASGQTSSAKPTGKPRFKITSVK